MELEQEIEHHRDIGHARVVDCDMNRRIIEDDEALPHFTWASQNVTAAAALLLGLPKPATPEDH